MVNVACENCGASINLDGSVVAVKKKLNKRIECAICRNARVAKDHEELDHVFLNIPEEEETAPVRKKVSPVASAMFF